MIFKWVWWFSMKDFQEFVFSYFLAASSFCRSLIVLSFHVFHGFPQESTLTFFDQMITWPNHCSCLSCKHFLMIFSFSLVLSSSAEFLSWDLTFHIHQTILESFLCSLFTSSRWTGDFHRAQHYILIIVGGWCRNGGGGGEGVSLFLLLYSSILFTVCGGEN